MTWARHRGDVVSKVYEAAHRHRRTSRSESFGTPQLGPERPLGHSCQRHQVAGAARRWASRGRVCDNPARAYIPVTEYDAQDHGRPGAELTCCRPRVAASAVTRRDLLVTGHGSRGSVPLIQADRRRALHSRRPLTGRALPLVRPCKLGSPLRAAASCPAQRRTHP